MSTLINKRFFVLNGVKYIYKKEKISPNEIQKTFGKVENDDMGMPLNYLPKTGVIHSIKYDEHTMMPISFEKKTKKVNTFGYCDMTDRESIHKNNTSLPYRVTLNGNHFETAYVECADTEGINNNLKTVIHEKTYDGDVIGYNKEYIKSEKVALSYTYYPNFLDPRSKNIHPDMDILEENSIINKAKRLINRFKKLDKNFFPF